MATMKRSVVITGAAKGIGQAIAQAFYEKQDRVILLDRDTPAKLLNNQYYIHCDVTSSTSLAAAAAELATIAPRIDILINNAGTFLPASFRELTPESWQATLTNTLTPHFLVTKTLVPLMASGGVIISMSSSLGTIPEPDAIAYSVAKAGVDMFTRCLALTLAPVGIRVLGIAPGPVQSGAIATEEICSITGENLADLNPLGRFATVEEISALVIFLASKDARYMTGTIISQNGGEDALSAAWSTLRQLRDTGKVNDVSTLSHLLNLDPSERVRLSAERVLATATDVSLNEEKLAQFVARLSVADIKTHYSWDRDFHPAGTTEQLINYVFTIDAVNFGSGFSPEWKMKRPTSTYQTVASTLTRVQAEGLELTAAFAAEITVERVADILGESPDFPLVAMFTQAWQSLGKFVVDQYGSYQQLLTVLPAENTAQALINLLVSNVPEFNDHALYNGSVVFFYKRAQILANDLHLALADDSPFVPADIAKLTMFADNLVAHVLETEGALEYSEDLRQKIRNKELITAGSTAEVEIRAAEIIAVEKAVKLLQASGFESCSPAMLDVYLWSIGQELQYKQYPRHLTKSFFY